MNPLLGLAGLKAFQSVTNLLGSHKNTEKLTKEDRDSFDTLFRQILNPQAADSAGAGEVFAAAVERSIASFKGTKAATTFHKLFTKELESSGGTAQDFESVSKRALEDMVRSGDLTAKEAQQIYAETYQAQNQNDSMMAVSKMEDALRATALKLGEYPLE